MSPIIALCYVFFLLLQPHECPPKSAVNGSCVAHDSVDLPLCFTDTAILYGVCVGMWALAALEFCCYSKQRHSEIPFNPVNISRLVSGLAIDNSNAHWDLNSLGPACS